MSKDRSNESAIVDLAQDLLILDARTKLDAKRTKKKLLAMESRVRDLETRIAQMEEDDPSEAPDLSNARRVADSAASGSNGEAKSKGNQLRSADELFNKPPT